MHTEKLSSSLKLLLSGVAEDDANLELLVRLDHPMTPATRAAIENLNSHIRTQAGDVITLTLPGRQLPSLSDLAEVIYIEAAQTLYPEAASPNHDPDQGS